jgi:hypothetical protein
MNEDLKSKLEKYQPIRVVLRINEGTVEGRVEHSFSMDWDATRANIFWSGKAYSILGEHQMDGVKWAKGNMNELDESQFLIDPLAEDSPIDVDWERWLAATDKFEKRNAKFTVKPHGVWMLRAKSAEAKLSNLQARYDSTAAALADERAVNNKIREIINHEDEE